MSSKHADLYSISLECIQLSPQICYSISNEEIKKMICFVYKKVLMYFIIVIYNDDPLLVNNIKKSFSWFEEWILYLNLFLRKS